MSPHAEPAPSTLDRIRRNLVGLKMPRALEVLEGTVRQIERGDITALEAIDALLSEELTLRQNRRVKMGLRTARITAAKTLAGFDFAFQPSLDRNRILTLAQLDFIDRHEAVHRLGPPGTGKSHLAVALGVEAVKGGRSVYFATLADIIASLAKAGARGRLARAHPLSVLVRTPDCGRDRLPAGGAGRGQPVLPAGERPLRAGCDDPHLQPRLCRMG